MGAWGTGFWQNDTALEVKEDFRKYFKYGSTDKDGIDYVIEKTIDINDDDDGPVVTMVIAGELWRIGRLDDEWHKKAVSASERDLAKWKSEVDQKTYNQHARSIKKFIDKLAAPQPEAKKIKRLPKPEPFINVWGNGDVIAIKNTKEIYMRKTRNSELETYNGGIIVFIVEEYHDDGDGKNDKYLSVFAKFDPDVTEFEQLDHDSIMKMSFVLGRIDLHFENKNEADKFVYIGKFKDLVERKDIGNEHTYHILSQLIPSNIVELFFQKQKGYWSTYSC